MIDKVKNKKHSITLEKIVKTEYYNPKYLNSNKTKLKEHILIILLTTLIAGSLGAGICYSVLKPKLNQI